MHESDGITTGLPGFDEIFHGGLLRNHAYLLVIAAGTGMTIVWGQWLRGGPLRIERDVGSFGWRLGAISLIDHDPVAGARYRLRNDYRRAGRIPSLVSFLYRSGCASFLIYAPSERAREAAVALAVFGVRSVQVEKLRGSDLTSGLHGLLTGAPAIGDHSPG